MTPLTLKAATAAEIMTAGPTSLHASATVDEATRFLTELAAHVKRMTKENDQLKPVSNPDDEKPAQRIKELTPELEKLERAARGFLDAKKKGGSAD